MIWRLLDIFTVVPLSMLYFFPQTLFDPKKGDANQRPILLVHGYLHNSSGWIYYRRLLKRAGYNNVFTINLGALPVTSIEEYAERLKKRADEIAELCGREDLILIGHSMGGIVSAYYALHLAKPGSVKQVYTLGSPLRGTKLSTLGVGPAAQFMTFHSPEVLQLSDEIKQAESPEFHHIAMRLDHHVVPYYSGLNRDDPEGETLIQHLGHLNVLFSKHVLELILSRIKTCSSHK